MISSILLVNSGLWIIATTYLFYSFFAAILLHQGMFFLLDILFVVLLSITEIILGAVTD